MTSVATFTLYLYDEREYLLGKVKNPTKDSFLGKPMSE